MTQNFRKTVMATTMLAGFAIFAIDAAQAGPNGGPSLGSISGFSSMRMDFNRVGGPGRALSRNDLRVVPIDAVKKTEKPKDTKNAAKKGTNVAGVSNPKSVSGGKGKQDVGNGPNLHIPAALADAYRVTGGNIGDLSELDEWAERLKIGPLVVANPLFPGNNGEGSFPFPWPKTDQEPADRNFLDGWSDYGGAPGGPNTSKTGWAADDGWSVGTTWHLPFVDWTYGAESDGDGNWRVHSSWTLRGPDFPPSASVEVKPDKDGNPSVETDSRGMNEVEPVEPVPVGKTDGKGSEKPEKEKAEKEKDSQPAGEGYGRPSTQTGWCSPTGGCLRPARNNGSPRIIPTEESSTPPAHRQSPGWATDPSEDGYSGGTGGGYTGYRPQDEEGGGIGGPGNPALESLNAAL